MDDETIDSLTNKFNEFNIKGKLITTEGPAQCPLFVLNGTEENLCGYLLKYYIASNLRTYEKIDELNFLMKVPSFFKNDFSKYVPLC
jgi:hypothetical protein